MALDIKSKVGLLGGTTLSVAAYIWSHYTGLWTYFITVPLGICGIVCLDILRLEVPKSHTVGSVLSLYLLHGIFVLLIRWCYSTYINTDPKKAQDQLLMKLIRTNQNTIYGNDYNFSAIKTPEDFIENHPITNYEHYESYFNRVIAGDDNIIVANSKVNYIVLTSGTTGNNKKYPVSMSGAHKIGLFEMFKMFSVGSYMVYTNFPVLRKLKLLKSLDILIIQDPILTDRGIRMGGVAGRFKMLPPGSAAPRLLLNIPTQNEALYLYALYGLKEEKVKLINASLATVGLKFFETIESNWQQLCDDIETGTIWENLAISSTIREELEKHLKADKKRAIELRKEFTKGMKGIAPRVWKELPYVSMISTGSFKIYADIVVDRYLNENVPVLTMAHSASEGAFGVIIEPRERGTELALNSAMFYEFISVDEDNADPIRVHQIEIGKCYELLITNSLGLYRYRFGDVIKIVGYKKKLPLYEFQYRAGQMLNLLWEKTPEGAFMDSVLNAIKQIQGVTLIDYTATENINMTKLRGKVTTVRHYSLFLEVTKNDDNVILPDKDLKKFDRSLCEEFPLYKVMRNDGKIQAMEVLQVKPHTFENLKQLMLRNNKRTTYFQFKMPRVQRNQEYLQFLLDNVL